MICASPRFVRSDDWRYGVSRGNLPGFRRGLRADYRGTLDRFVALEAFGSDHAKEEIHALRHGLFARGEPAARVLADGLELLETVDLRAVLPALSTPSLWLAGRRDRLVDSRAMRRGAACRDAEVDVIDHAGHAPFLTHADVVASRLRLFLERCSDAWLFDRRHVRRAFSRAATSYDAAARLQRDVRDHLLESLDYLDQRVPEVVLDLGSGPGHAATAMRVAGRKRRCWRWTWPCRCWPPPGAEAGIRCAVRATGVRGRARLALGRKQRRRAVLQPLLQWVEDLPAVFAGFRRVLRPGGLLLVSTFGPDTLQRAARGVR